MQNSLQENAQTENRLYIKTFMKKKKKGRARQETLLMGMHPLATYTCMYMPTKNVWQPREHCQPMQSNY